jgi:hypothetical protein
METEPTGRTIDGTPWEEPRPPHLPDTLTRVSPWVFPFLLVAGLQVVVAWVDWVAQGDLRDPNAVELIVVQWLPGVCASLLGAALFSRHPDANRRLPMLVVGVVLLNVAALMEMGRAPLTRALVDASPVGEDSFETVFLWSGIYAASITVVGIVAVLYIARGLAGARRLAHVAYGHGFMIALIALVAVASVLSLAPYITLPDASRAEVLTPANVLNLILGRIETLAWVFLLVIVVRGWLAGERPRIGWLLVALAAVIDVIFLVMFAMAGLVHISGSGLPLFLLTWLGVARWVLLLAAFASGLPSTAVGPVADEPQATPTGDPLAATRSGSGAD